MRISDWSSDVCSSDLHSRPWLGRIDVPTAVVVMTKDRVIPTPRQYRFARAIPGATVHEVEEGHAGCVLGAERFVPVFLEAVNTAHARRRDFKIGRAQGRERVCKSASISVVAETL